MNMISQVGDPRLLQSNFVHVYAEVILTGFNKTYSQVECGGTVG